MAKRRRLTAAFKARVAKDALRGNLSVQQIAAKHGVHPNQVSHWKRKASQGLVELFKRGAKIGQLVIERDFLICPAGHMSTRSAISPMAPTPPTSCSMSSTSATDIDAPWSSPPTSRSSAGAASCTTPAPPKPFSTASSSAATSSRSKDPPCPPAISTLCGACRIRELNHETPSQPFSELFYGCARIPEKSCQNNWNPHSYRRRCSPQDRHNVRPGLTKV